jgi:glycosyltransferase involved in cell wall biosynthesis
MPAQAVGGAVRIALLSGEYPPMQGGVGDYTREMARAFSSEGHAVAVIVPRALAGADSETDRMPWHVLPVVTNWRWGCWRAVGSAVRELQPDIVDIQYQAAAYDMRIPAINLMPWHLHRATDAAVVVTFHDLRPPYLFPKAGPLRNATVRRLGGLADAAIVTNAEDEATARAWWAGGAGHRPQLHHIPIGSNVPVSLPAGYERRAWRAACGYGDDDLVWAYFGFLNESKGGETLVQGLAQAPHHHKLLMVGGRVGTSDPTNEGYAGQVEALIEALGLADRVAWTGYVSTEEVSAALVGSDIAVLPYRDGISFRRGSLHAALVHGCAIVSTVPRTAIPELRPGENVLLVSPDDPHALADAALNLEQDEALRRRIGRGARRLSAMFTWDHIARRTVDEAFRPLLRPEI